MSEKQRFRNTNYEPANLDEPEVYEPNQAESPPSYDTLFGRLVQLSEEVSDPKEYTQKIGSLVCQSALSLILLGLSTAIPIAMLIIGSMYINDCPAQKLIPIWLIVFGSVWILSALISITTSMYERIKKLNNEEYKPSLLKNFKYIIDLFLLVFFITGNVWVYQIYTKVRFDVVLKGQEKLFCDRVVYLFSFWIIIAIWCLIFIAFSLLCICLPCILCCLCMKRKK